MLELMATRKIMIGRATVDVYLISGHDDQCYTLSVVFSRRRRKYVSVDWHIPYGQTNLVNQLSNPSDDDINHLIIDSYLHRQAQTRRAKNYRHN